MSPYITVTPATAALIIRLLGEPLPNFVALGFIKFDPKTKKPRKVYAPSPLLGEEDAATVIACHLRGAPIPPRPGQRKDGSNWPVRNADRIGSYCLRSRPGGMMCGWVCLDVDGSDHSVGQNDSSAWQITCSVSAMMQQARLFPIIERSHGGHGYHVWSLFSNEQPADFCFWMASLVMQQAQEVCPKAVLEAFPKQSESPRGSLVGLPLAGCVAAHGGGRLLWTDETERDPATVEMVSEAALAPFKAAFSTVQAAQARMIEVQEAAQAVLRPESPVITPLLYTGSSALDRCRRYLARVPGAVADGTGHPATFKVCCLGSDFGLQSDVFWPLLWAWNARCIPPWDEPRLRAVLADAEKHRARSFGCRLTG